MKPLLFACMLFTYSLTHTLTLNAQDILPLYPSDSIPNSKPATEAERSEQGGDGILRVYKVSQPSLAVYLPPAGKANGTAVIICPGGGYRLLAASHEGADIARTFNEWGVTAFVLKYRLPDENIMEDKSIGPLQDAQRAIQLVREKAKLWSIDPRQVGIMGFSAGGHLAAMATVHYDDPKIANPLGTSLRPDFAILAYPVLSFSEELAHKGSREQLLGKEPTAAQIKYYSAEENVNKKTPPVFLMHARDDKAVKVENSLNFKAALDKFKVRNDIYLYDQGGHGFGMKNRTSDVEWMKYVKQWMFGMDLILQKR